MGEIADMMIEAAMNGGVLDDGSIIDPETGEYLGEVDDRPRKSQSACKCDFPIGAFLHIQNPKKISLTLPTRWPVLFHKHTSGKNRYVYRIEHLEGVTVTFSRPTLI